MRILCVFGKHNYGNQARGESYEYVNVLPALRRLGHEVSHFDSWDKKRYRDFAALNRSLLETVEERQPEAVLFVLMSYEVWLETLDAIRQQCGAVLVNWAPDDSWKYEQSSRFFVPHFDIHATTYRDAARKAVDDGARIVFRTQWAANAESLREPLPAKDCGIRVSFIGSAYGNRPRWVAALRDRGIDVACFGHGWAKGSVRGSEIPSIIGNSVISLNFSDASRIGWKCRSNAASQIKARVFEVPGAGGFLLTQDAPGLSDFYKRDEEIATFGNVDELVAKVQYFLNHPEERDRIAQAGHRRTVKDHTYDHRFNGLLHAAQNVLLFRRRPGKISTQCCFNWSGFAEWEARHAVGPALLFLRDMLVAPCRLMLGQARGGRAARYLVYEASWRLAGRHTYTAAGLPGRLFYWES